MTSTFTAKIKIKVTHDKGTFIDTNSVKGLIGPGVTVMLQGLERLCEVGDKTEGTPEAVDVSLDSLKEGQVAIEIDDFNQYI